MQQKWHQIEIDSTLQVINWNKNKLKASKLNSQVKIGKNKAKLYINYAFQKIARYIELENF